MKRKKLNRDGWGFQYFPYYQMRVDCESFHGLVCYIKLVDGAYQYWDTPIAGHVAVCGGGMSWLQMIPDGQKRLITTMYFRDGAVDEFRTNYPDWARDELCPSVWYVDVTEGYDIDENGIAVYTDKYLDVIFFPEGEISISDRDELDEAYKSGDITKEQYESGIAEGDAIVKELCGDIKATAHMCAEVRRIVDERIREGYRPMYYFPPLGEQGTLAGKPVTAQAYVRTAAPEDAERLLEIYAPYVTDTAITFEYED